MSTKKMSQGIDSLDCESINNGRTIIHKVLKIEKLTADSTEKIQLATQKVIIDDVCDSLYQRCVSLKEKQKPTNLDW